ncbi:hypothetical protein BDR26DRAFT_850004 [Obelidium mucronatum]|nr:hypothetical protein BDR26DRAFT_850004 [Obelidium mucronatum]
MQDTNNLSDNNMKSANLNELIETQNDPSSFAETPLEPTLSVNNNPETSFRSSSSSSISSNIQDSVSDALLSVAPVQTPAVIDNMPFETFDAPKSDEVGDMNQATSVTPVPFITEGDTQNESTPDSPLVSHEDATPNLDETPAINDDSKVPAQSIEPFAAVENSSITPGDFKGENKNSSLQDLRPPLGTLSNNPNPGADSSSNSPYARPPPSGQMSRRSSSTTRNAGAGGSSSNNGASNKPLSFPVSSIAALKRTNEKLMQSKAAATQLEPKRKPSAVTAAAINPAAASPTWKTSVSGASGGYSPKPQSKPPIHSAKSPSPRNSSSTAIGMERTDSPDLMAQLDRILSTTSASGSQQPTNQTNIEYTTKKEADKDPLLKLSNESAASEIYTIKKELASKEDEIMKLKEEILFLERWREQESQIRTGAAVGVGIAAGGVGGGGGGGGASAGGRIGVIGDLASKEDIERARKEIQEQETLIQGYQHENEKLIDQLKIAKKQHKDQESRSFLRIETLHREIQTLKTTLNNPSQQQPASFDSVKLAAKVDELTEKLHSQEREFVDKEAGYQGEIAKLKAQLSEMHGVVDGFKGWCSVEDVDALKRGWDEERNRLESFIVELEGRIEKEVAYKEMLMEKENLEVEARLADVGLDRKGKAGLGSVSSTRVSASNLAKGKSANGGPEGRRIKELEKLCVELQEKLTRKENSLPNLLLANRPTMEEETYIRHLKDHIKRLQNDMEAKETAWFSKLQILHSETTDLKERYEEKLTELQIRMEETQAASAQAIASAASMQSIASTNHISDLEQQLESLLAKYHDKLVEATDLEIADHLHNAESKIALAYKSREAKLRTRVVELENLVDSQATTMESMRADRAAAEREAQLRTQMKDALVQSYETKISNMRKEFHDRVFGGEEQKLLAEIHRLRMEVESLRGENSDFKNRLEISEATRQSVHESTIAILKQAQEESAKIALAHHERALTMLRDETKSQTAALLDSEVRRLQKALAETEIEITRWQNKVAVLEKEKQSWRDGQRNATLLMEAQEKLERMEQNVKELQILNNDLQTQLHNSRRQWPPDQKRFNELESTLEHMETKFKQREMELQELISLTKRDADGQIAKIKAKYIPLLEKRDKELLYFRDEVFRLVEALEDMKQ